MVHSWVLLLLTSSLGFAQFQLQADRALRVQGDQEGVIKIELPKEKTFLKPFVVFVRPKGNDFEIIARGRVETVQNEAILVTLDRGSIIKYPLAGDLAVPLGTPRDWPPDTDPQVAFAPIQAKQPEDPPDPGYIQFLFGKMFNDIDSSASDDYTNEYKDAKRYQPEFKHFLWYFEFFWNLGIEYESFGGKFPTFTYYHEFGPSTDNLSLLSINYRLHKRWLNGRLRPTFRLLALQADFLTLNRDEALISSSTTATGLGFRLSYEPINMVWKPDTPRSALKFRQAYVDIGLYPSVMVNDSEYVKRGTGSPNSQIYDLKLGADTIIYLNWVPYFKRFMIEAGYRLQYRNLNFAGPTSSEVAGAYTIPSGLSSTEMYKGYYIAIGMCFEDYIGGVFKPR